MTCDVNRNLWTQLWEMARKDGILEWRELDKRGESDAFLLAERIRLMDSKEKQQLAEWLGWSYERTRDAINRVQGIVIDTDYPDGRPKL